MQRLDRQTGPPGASAEIVHIPVGEPSESVRMVEIFETLLTALILALVFRAFFVEAFIIPTGSMASGLNGQHLAWVCPNCGWEFAIGPANYGDESQFVPPVSADCPNCHHTTDLRDMSLQPRQGDRIIVHKWPYIVGDLLPVRRWDVIVFRDPVNPSQNYIKRVVGLPGESVEILDGDVYIARPGEAPRIVRKTPAAQRSLWSVVWDQDYLPVERASVREPPAWFADAGESAWRGLETRTLRFDPRDEEIAWLRFGPPGSTDYLRDVVGYNYAVARNFVGDLRVAGDVTFAPQGGPGVALLELERDGRRYVAQLTSAGQVRLDAFDSEGARRSFGPAQVRVRPGSPVRFELRHLDRVLEVRIDDRAAVTSVFDDSEGDLEILRGRIRGEPVQVRIGATGRALTCRHMRIDRDVYYTLTSKTLRAGPGQPFPLGPEEYFVLGDNSPSSHDSREWHRVGPHLEDPDRPRPYRLGTVPRDQIVGRAFFVYLPGLVPGANGAAWRIPDFGRMRFVR